MPSIQHEGLVEMFRQQPELAAVLLRDVFGLRLPAYRSARVDSADMSDPVPLERRADAVVAFTARAGRPVLAAVVEVQLRPKKDKQWSWPYYLAKLRVRLRCPVLLLVVTPHAATALACAAGIDLGHPGWVLYPLVCGPDQVPVITDAGQVAGVAELSVLSAMMHGGHPDYRKVLDALQVVLAATDQDRAASTLRLCSRCCPRRPAGIWRDL